ncbi:TERF2IP [Symbiodinium natans]|uniref:TERF2IP protein n=1 Tax=Symbiodinium natans TaxID=878477 RepID=A0A812I113_9DINO|nr:TERF2IP [Symbiodinium natans]
MPVPWSTERRCTFIPDVAERGLQVRQLWDLTIFLKRLCKTKCLTRPAAVGEGEVGRWLEWQSLDLYDITDLVIKKYIPYHDLQWQMDESDPEVAKRYSWAELVCA